MLSDELLVVTVAAVAAIAEAEFGVDIDDVVILDFTIIFAIIS